MAHQVDSLAYFGAIPWHKLGTPMTDAERRSLPAAIERAGLDWNVEAIPLRKGAERQA